MKLILFFFSSLLLLISCGTDNEKFKTVNPNADYFYPIDTVPKVYLYRDIVRGLEEEFHRVYAISDFAGEHIVVERYASDGRILDAVNYDVDAALELLSTYKAIREVSQAKADAQVDATIEADKVQRKQNLRAASVQTGGSGETPQKFFRRQDILRLMMYDRERYHALEPEIRQAYAEGRVKG